LNEIGGNALSDMPKNDPTLGPMGTQPGEHASTMPTQVLPAMPTAGNKPGAPQPEQPPVQEPTRGEAVRTAKARITRRNSLRKQRQALKD
jgi:hypothetical protein